MPKLTRATAAVPSANGAYPPESEPATSEVTSWDAIRETVERLTRLPSKEHCYEVRAINWRDRERDPRGRFKTTVSGYFDDPKALARAAVALSGSAEGVYLIPNPLVRATLCRAKNRVEWRAQHATSDEEVLRRWWLCVDCDPVRPAHVSATDPEHDAGIARARAIRDYLRREGFGGLVLADSGNGGHVLIPIDEANDTGNSQRHAATLQCLAAHFDDDYVRIDPKMYNAARLVKFYGTIAAKGDHAPEEGRPWRVSRILEADPRG